MKDRIRSIRIEPLNKNHKRKDFICGKPELDNYLQRFARQNDRKNIAKCFVAVDGDVVLAYYTLSSSSVEFEAVPENLSKQLPHYPVPAALIGKLAVDQRTAGLRLGEKCLIDALQRTVSVADDMAIKVLLVDALDDNARAFYLHYGFIELPGQARKLFLPIETIRASLEAINN